MGRQLISMLGMRSGKLKVIEELNVRNIKGKLLVKCRCDCGNEILVDRNRIQGQHILHCGCMIKTKKGLIEREKINTIEEEKTMKLKIAEQSIKDYMQGLREGRYNSKMWVTEKSNGHTR